MTRYKVTAPYVTCRSEKAALLQPDRRQRYAISGFNRGQWLPEDAHPDDIERLLRRRMIELIEPVR